MNIKLILAIICVGAACTKKHISGSVIPASPADSSKTYLALGDSYTIGQSVAVSERFPAQTVALLKQLGNKISDPLYIAQTG